MKSKPMNHLTHIEPLEDRIAPATILNPYTVTYQNVDVVNGTQVIGDTVIVKISKPLFTSPAAAAKILLFTDVNGNQITESFTGNGTAEFLSEINLLGRHDAQDMNISVKVLPQVGIGSGQVNVGSIQAANFGTPNQVTENIDLGSVYIQGNLGLINVGDNYSTPALKSLSVLSMTSDAQSNVLGPILNLDVQGNFTSNMQVIGYQYGSIKTLTVGGALAGDSAGDSDTGVIEFTGHVGKATIGSISGTAGTSTAELVGTATNSSRIGTLDVLGSITGGSGQDSGRVFAQVSIGKVNVGGSVMGGAGQDSGEIAGPLGTVKISGALMGGAGTSSGTVLGETFNSAGTFASAKLNSVTIGGDVTGSSGQGSGEIAGVLGTVVIQGNLNGGSGVSSGALISHASIVDLGQIVTIPAAVKTVAIGGNVTGGSAGTAAFGTTAATAGDTGIISASSAKSIRIGGSLIGGTQGTTVNTSGALTQSADTSGVIMVDSVTSLAIGAGIIGGNGPNSGLVEGLDSNSSYGSIAVTGSITGGAGATSGAIVINSINSLTIGGSVNGGAGSNSGEIVAAGTLKNAVIMGNLTGDQSIDSATAVVGSGYIQAGRILALDIKGNVTSGANSGGAIANSGAIRTTQNIASLTIGGAVTGTAADPVVISGEQGPSNAKSGTPDIAIGTVSIGGDATYLDLLAGYSPNVSTTSGGSTNAAGAPLGTPVDGSAQITSITILGSMAASNLVAGVEPDSNGFFGTTGNTPIPTKVLSGGESLIAKVVIEGTATGDSTPGDSFGIVAEGLESVSVDGSNNLATGLTPGTPAPVNGSNLFLLEVPA